MTTYTPREGDNVWVDAKYAVIQPTSVNKTGLQNRIVKRVVEDRKIVVLDCGGTPPFDALIPNQVETTMSNA